MKQQPVTLFYSYASEDEPFRVELEKHLSPLRRQEVLSDWHAGCLEPGQNRNTELLVQLKQVDIFVPLVSSDYIASDACYKDELKWAIQNHLQIIPVLLRPVDLSGTLLDGFSMLPSNVKAISQCKDRDNEWVNIVRKIRKANFQLWLPKLTEEERQEGKPSTWRDNLAQWVNQICCNAPGNDLYAYKYDILGIPANRKSVWQLYRNHRSQLRQSSGAKEQMILQDELDGEALSYMFNLVGLSLSDASWRQQMDHYLYSKQYNRDD